MSSLDHSLRALACLLTDLGSGARRVIAPSFLVACAMLLAAPAMAADWYASPSGVDSNTCDSAAATCKTIQAAINKAAAGDTVHVGVGSYPFNTASGSTNTGVYITKSINLIGDGDALAGNAANRATLVAPTTSFSTGRMIYVSGAADVLIQNLYIELNHGKTSEAILALGAVDGLVVDGNYIRITSGGTSLKNNAISVNAQSTTDRSTPTGGALGIGQFSTIRNNVISSTTSALGARALLVENGGTLIQGNTISGGSTNDVRVRFNSGGTVTLDDNDFGGRGVNVVEPNVPVIIKNNRFQTLATAVDGGSSDAADYYQLRLDGTSNTQVQNNSFSGYGRYFRAAYVERSPGVSFTDNTFTPKNTGAIYDSIGVLIENKSANTGNPASAPTELSASFLRNTFNGSGVANRGYAVGLLNSNDAGGTTATFGAITFGSTNPADANTFDSNLRWYIYLGDLRCNTGSTAAPGKCPTSNNMLYRNYGNSGGTPGTSSQAWPFRGDVTALNNRFDGVLGGDLTGAQFDAAQAKIQDNSDNAALGTVNMGTRPLTTVGTIDFAALIYTGSPQAIVATLQEDATATCVVTPATVLNAGDVAVSATCTSASYNVTDATTINVAKAVGTVSLAQTSFVYSAGAYVLSASMAQDALATCTATPASVTDAGTTSVSVSCDGSNYAGTAAIDVTVSKASTTIELVQSSYNYTNANQAVQGRLVAEPGTLCAATPATIKDVGAHTISVAACEGSNYQANAATLTATVGGGTTVHVVETDTYYATVAGALADPATLAGYTVELAGGTYSGSITLTKSVKLVGGRNFTPPIVLNSFSTMTAGPGNPPATLIDGNGAAGSGIIVPLGVQNVQISGFEIRNFAGVCVDVGTTPGSGPNNDGLTITENVIHACGSHGVHVNAINDISTVTISNNEVYNVGGRGIAVWNGVKRDVTIADNWVHDLTGCCGIELQDGSATGAVVTGNLVENTGDSGMGFVQLTSGSPTSRANVISGNTVTNTGRFGIEIKIPNGTGLDSGDGAILVENNTVSGPTDYTLGDVRDRAGISIIRRSLNSATYPFQVDSTLGVIVRLNTVSGFKTLTPSTSYRGYGLVIEGLGSSVYNNILTGNDVAVQVQQANPNGLPPGDSNQTPASAWFGRGNAPLSCVGLGANVATGNTLGDAAKFQPASASMLGGIKNETTGAWYCSFNIAIAAATAGDTLSVIAGTYAENVIVNKKLTIKGPKAGVHGNDAARAAGDGEAVIKPATGVGISISSNDVIVDGLTVQTVSDSGLQSGARNGIHVLNNRFVTSVNRGIYVEGSPPSTGWLIEGNLFDTLTGTGSTAITLVNSKDLKILDNVIRNVTYQGVQLSGAEAAEIRGNIISDTDFDGINVANGNGVVIAENTITSVNRLSGADRGAMRLYAGMTGVSIFCNNIDATKGGIVLRSGTTSGLNVFHNAVIGGTSVVSYWTAGADIGSNWYGGNAVNVGGLNANDLRVADALGANPIGNASCDDNSAFALVAYAGTGTQSAAINTAFSPLRARVQDILGGAVMGESVSLSAATAGSGATAALATTSGNTNYNGELISAATANAVAGAYTVTASSGALTAATFNLTNTQGTATITLDAPSFVYAPATSRQVSVTTTPSGLEGDVQVTYTNAVTSAVTGPCVANASGCGPIIAGSYTVAATLVGNVNYGGSATSTLAIAKATGTVTFDNLALSYTGAAQTITAHITEEAGSACTVTPTSVGPAAGSTPVSASCSGSNYDASASDTAVISAATATVTLSHLTQPYDGAPKSVVVTTAPAGLAVNVTYNGNATLPIAIGAYPVIATVADPNYTGSISGTLQIVAGTSDIALVLNGPVDPVRVGDTAQYAATMLANPALHSGESFGYNVVLSKAGGNHPLELTDLASMEVFYQGVWVDAMQAFGSIPFQMVGGNLVYVFPEGILNGGFPIEDASWTWNFRFSFADTGTYTTTAELVDGISHAPINPAVTASLATVVEAALPPTDMHLILGGPAGNVTLGAFAEYNGTLLANPALHTGENFFVKVTMSKSTGAMTAADFTAMQIFLNNEWVDGDTLGVTFTDDGHGNLVYLFPESQMPGGFPITDAQWSWNFRFAYANIGVYTATAQVIPADQAILANPDVLASAAVATTVVAAPVVTPDMKLLLLGPVDDIEVSTPAAYTGTLLANPADFSGRTFWVRVRLSKNRGTDLMTAADLAKMELYLGGWQDATSDLKPQLVQDGNTLVYLFPQPNAAFPIDASVWTWRFRFTYASAGLYGAVADVVDAASMNPAAAPSLANATVETNVVPQTAHIALQLQGPVAGVVVGQPAQYVGTLRADPLPDASELFFVKVRLHKSTGPMVPADLQKMEIFQGGSWVDGADYGITFAQDAGDLVYLFPKPFLDNGFPIDSAEWSWQFRFTYGDAAVYTATAQVIHAVDSSPASAPVSISTDVVAQSPNVALQINGPVADVQVDVPAAYIGTLTNNGPALAENAFVKVRVALAGEVLVVGDLTAEVSDGAGGWIPGTLSAVNDGLEIDFPDSSGFPIGAGFAYTHQFRITYRRPGVFSATASVVGANTATVYATSSMYTEVVPRADVVVGINIDPASLHVVYDGLTHVATATTTPAGLPVTFSYNGLATAPVDVGQYVVVASVNAAPYIGSASAILVIDKAPSTVTINAADLHQSVGATHAVGASATPTTVGASITLIYNGSSTVPSATGSYTVVATLNDPNYYGNATGTLVVDPGSASITLDGPLTAVYDEAAHAVTATTNPVGLAYIVTYNGLLDAPSAVGSYAVVATISDPNYSAAPATGTLVISSATAGIVLDAATLNATYDGQLHAVTATTSPTGLAYNVTYNGNANPPVDAGSYAVVATITAPGHSGSVSGTLVIAKAVGTVVFGSTNFTFDGAAHVTTALIAQEPANSAACTLAATSGEYPRINAGSTTLNAACTGTNYTASGGTTLVVSPKPVTIALSGTGSFPYDGNPHAATASVAGTVSGFPASTVVAYDGGATAPSAVGTYTVVATLDTASSVNYSATPANGTITIGAANATVTLGNLSQVFDGTERTVTATTTPTGLATSVTYDGSATAPTNAGTYTVVATITAPGYSGSASGTLVVAKAAATVTLSNLSATYDGNSHAATATTLPASLAVTITYDDSATAPTNAGSYAVVATVTDANYGGSTSATLTIAKAAATVTVSDTTQIYDGTPKAVTVVTSPIGLATNVTYDGSATAPSAVGTYAVAVSVTDSNYTGTANATLQVVTGTATAIAANGPIAFTGTAGQPLTGALPSVKVTDAGGNAVAGVAITFAASAGNGTLSGATQTTDGNGIATLGGWTLDATPGTDTVIASAAGVTDTVAFTSTSTAASNALSVTITDGRTFAQYGHALTYTITVGNAGSSNLTAIAVSDVLPPELDPAATWQCIALNGATCTVSGNGDLIDTVNLPAHSSVVYLLNTTAVRGPSDRISNTITATGPDGAVSATDITDVVLFRDGFELGGNGAQAIGGEIASVGNLSGAATLELAIATTELGSLSVTTIAAASNGAFRVEAVRIGDQVWLRLVARNGNAEQASAWSALRGATATLALGRNALMLVGTANELSIALGQGGPFTVERASH